MFIFENIAKDAVCEVLNVLQVELREHDHVVECVSWCEGATDKTIREASSDTNTVGPFLASGGRDKTIKVSNGGLGEVGIFVD